MNASACAGVSIRRDIVLYVEQLIAPDVVDAMPEVTVRTFAITAELEREGVRSFCDSYHELLDCIEAKVERTAVAR